MLLIQIQGGADKGDITQFSFYIHFFFQNHIKNCKSTKSKIGESEIVQYVKNLDLPFLKTPFQI